MKTIIGCPVHNREWILPYYLEHLYNLENEKKNITLYFLLNNCTDNSELILRQFKQKYEYEYASIVIEKYKSKHKFEDNRTEQVRLNYTYYHLSDLRNKLLKFATNSGCDYLLSCDSDILLRPDTLTKLLTAEKEICSGLIWNGYIRNKYEAYKFSNILNYDTERKGYIHICNWYVKNSPTLKEQKIIEVDATGALILMTKEVASKTRYSFHIQGEDMHWSKDCQDKGFKLYSRLDAYAYHMMSEKLLNEYLLSQSQK